VRYRSFGKTGLQISELVYGAGAVGGLLIRENDDTKREAIRRAIGGGINWIDTAPAYGNGASESALGWLLDELDTRPYVSTKVGINPVEGDFRGQVERSLHESLTRLRTSRVDLLQLHNPVMPETGTRTLGVDAVLGPSGVADALERAVAEGLTDYIGFTAIGDAASCRRVIESGRFQSAQVYYNVVNPSAGLPVPTGWSGYDFRNLVSACAQQGVAVLNIRVLAAGVIATDKRHGREIPIVPNSEVERDEKRVAAVFDRLGARYGTRAQTAIRFALAHGDISGVLIGIGELDQIDEALAATALGPLPQEALAELGGLYATDFGEAG
jgi:L-galactose dehydrogenase/L-glyceraldehyde 3-phosphate reductase